MNASWERVTRLFDAARALGESDRAAFLDAACAQDAGLRPELERLLASDAIDNRFLAEPAYRASGDALDGIDERLPRGLVLKQRYVIEELFDSGGQARVYRATDNVLSRAVVVKVMRAGGALNSALKRRSSRR